MVNKASLAMWAMFAGLGTNDKPINTKRLKDIFKVKGKNRYGK